MGPRARGSVRIEGSPRFRLRRMHRRKRRERRALISPLRSCPAPHRHDTRMKRETAKLQWLKNLGGPGGDSMWCLLHLTFLLTARHVGATTCLPDGTPEADRKNVVVDGESMPLGIWVSAFDSSLIVSKIYEIIAQEPRPAAVPFAANAPRFRNRLRKLESTGSSAAAFVQLV